jgi:L-lactate dehydrogenase complex protein LldG
MVASAAMSTARDEILQRIRSALHDVPATERAEDVAIERTYRHRDELTPEERVTLFAKRVAEYQARVRRVEQVELPAAIAAACNHHGVRRLVVPTDLPEEWVPEEVESIREQPDAPLTAEELDAVDGVLTSCALAIAHTGTIVLDGGPGQGRRALTLLPDYHLCVVRTDQIVGLVPEAIARLHNSCRPITLISGPSATSDIELDRVEGVHGPRTLEVLIVASTT